MWNVHVHMWMYIVHIYTLYRVAHKILSTSYLAFNVLRSCFIHYQCAGKRTFATPKPNPNPQNQASFQKTRSKVPKTQKTGCAYSEHYTK